MNPYLASLRERYEGLRSGIEGLQARAASEGRDLTDTELTSIREQGEQARALHTQISELTEIEARHADVAALAARVETEQRAEETRSTDPATRGAQRVGSAYTRDRDPGHYRREGGHSFFGDLFAARSLQDGEALRRLTEHNRVLDMTNEGPGVIPPVWMAQEFAELAVQQRRVANAVRNIPLSSAAPISMPKQSAASGTVAELATEGTSTTDFTDGWDSAVDTVSPKATSGGQKVSRQMLDSSNPAVDALIYSDLIAEYNSAVEAKVVAAMVTAAGSAVTTYATEAAWTTALGNLDVTDDLMDLAIAVRNARKLPADILVCSVTRYGDLLKLKDSTGRPLMPADSAGPVNVIGTGTAGVDGRLFGLGVLASDGVTQYPESILAARASDTILFESPVLRFRYEEPDGPETIRLGIWAYTACHVKYSGSSVKRNVITAAA